MSLHFNLPFTLGHDGQFAVVDQDSDEDITVCVRAILLSRVGYRDDRPEVGITDPVHTQGGPNLDTLEATVAEFEPRADRLFSRDPTLLASIVDHVLIAKPSGGE